MDTFSLPGSAGRTADQVIVVGAGPVGLLLACELRLGGADVTVVEKLEEPATQSRASTLHARTMEILDERGLLGGLGLIPSQQFGHFGGLPVDFGELDTVFPGQWKVAQRDVETLLAKRAAELGADLRRGLTVSGLTDLGDTVRVEASGPHGVRTFTGAYVVGCDGESGIVRSLAGIGRDGRGPTRELIRADVTGVDIPDRRFQRLPGGLAISSTRQGVTRVMVAPRAAGPRTAPVTFAELCRTWRDVTGEDLDAGVCTWINAFDDANWLAGRYRAGRVLLAGDAAHQQMPSGGQAINLGLQDAMALGWRLAAVVAASAPDRLLDDYHDERHAVGRQVLANIDAQGQLLLGGDEVEPVRRILAELIAHPQVRDHLAAMISGLGVRYPAPEQAPALTGTRLPRTKLVGRGAADSSEGLRGGRALLLGLSRQAGLRRKLLDAAVPWAGRVDVFSAHPPQPALGDRIVVVRPDGYIAWIGSPGDDPVPALRRWLGPGTH